MFENEGQIEYGYKTLKFMVFDYEEDISVVYTSERFIWNLTLRCKHQFMTSKCVKTKKMITNFL